MGTKHEIGAIIISDKILKDNGSPNWMYRTQPIEDGDSGWRVFSGDEDDEYLDNPRNFKTISAEQLLHIDGDIVVNLYAPIGWSFERNGVTGSWIPVDRGDESI
jgi:hypothetical protein